MSISAGLGAVLPPVGYGFRNVIFNGNFMVNQRGYTSGTNLASGSYGFDRWKSNYTNTALTFTSAPQGQTVTISASGVIRQVIEQANVAVGPYVLSWKGSAVGRVYNDGATAPAYSSSPLSVTLDGSANVIVEFTPSSGTATLGEVQLEKGQRQTPFEYRPVSIELALCQRYYEQSSVTPTLGNAQGSVWCSASDANALTGAFHFRVTKRTTTPTVTIYNTNTLGSGSLSEYTSASSGPGSFVTNRTASVYNAYENGFYVVSNGQLAAARMYNFTWTASSEL